MKLREYDAVLLLLSLCEVQQCKPSPLQAPPSRWPVELTRHHLDSLLSNSGLGFSHLNQYIDLVTRCWRFVGSQTGVCRKVEREVGASPAAVVALPAAVTVRAVECVICKEEMSEGSGACELPCEHLFHWMCILRWLRKKSTCPVCRFRLPSDDILGEIQRLWSVVVDMSLQNSKLQNV
ncbi:Zinc finger, RING-type [Dillenia turbinata]|uniref:RING-type E3 ubiquitin transferase n=1 Tax=Dillenia turbinata TaxID=194707 RepID=A0AAN8VXV8_9MAGN